MKQFRLSLFCSLLMLFCFKVNAQQNDSASVEVSPAEADTAYYEEDEEEYITDTAFYSSVIFFPADSFRVIQKDKAFSYAANLDSLLKARQDAMLADLKKQSNINPVAGFGTVLKFLLWIVVATGIIFLIYKLFLADGGLFAAPQKNKSLQLSEEELTDEDALNKQLEDAIRTGNFRLAIRFAYLKTLFELSARKLLVLSPDKTNYQYVRELAKHRLQPQFARITLHYEYVWYGDFKIEPEVFQLVKQEFDLFLKNLKQS
jgi:hypothetical protein